MLFPVIGARARFRAGWALTWGLVAAFVWIAASTQTSNTSATVHASGGFVLTESARLTILLVGCAFAAGFGVFAAMTGVQMPAADRWWSAGMWAAIAAATVAANWYLADHHGPGWWYRSASRTGFIDGVMRAQTVARNPWMVHLVFTLPIAGALGGLAQYLAPSADTGTRRTSFAITWTLLWGATFLLARYLGVILVYIGISLVGPALGTLAGGLLTGLVVGTFLSFSPGLEWKGEGVRSPNFEVRP